MLRKWVLRGVIPTVFILPGLCSAQSTVETGSQSLLSAFVSYTDLRISSVQQSLEILASTTEVKSRSWEQMKGLLSVYQKSDTGLIAWYARPDGKYFTVDKGLMDANLSERGYFPDLLKGRKIIGALVVSKSTGQRSAVIAVPVKEGSKVVGAVGASLFLDKLSDQVGSTLALRTDAAFFALAPDGLTTLHRKTDRHFLDPRDLGSETLKKAANEMLSKTSGETTYEFDNVTKRAIYGMSSLAQWKFAITFNAVPQK